MLSFMLLNSVLRAFDGTILLEWTLSSIFGTDFSIFLGSGSVKTERYIFNYHFFPFYLESLLEHVYEYNANGGITKIT